MGMTIGIQLNILIQDLRQRKAYRFLANWQRIGEGATKNIFGNIVFSFGGKN